MNAPSRQAKAAAARIHQHVLAVLDYSKSKHRNNDAGLYASIIDAEFEDMRKVCQHVAEVGSGLIASKAKQAIE